jgi:hypothetical protein
MTIRFFAAATATNGPPADTKAGITITSVAGSALVDQESFTIMREDGIVFTFKFVTTTFTATDILRPVVFAGGDSSTTTAAAIATAINASVCGCTATSSSATVTVKRATPGPQGNGGKNTEAVANGTFAISAAFTSGALAGFALVGAQAGLGSGYGWRGEDRGAFQMHSTAGSGTMTCTLRAWGRSKADGTTWEPMGATNSDVTLRGVLHGGVAIGEDGADNLQHNENVSGLAAFDRVYLEIVAIGGTATAITAYLEERA